MMMTFYIYVPPQPPVLFHGRACTFHPSFLPLVRVPAYSNVEGNEGRKV
jgi:hypothetical protein